jgi:uncharacterized protein YabE (DUF348 family)
MMALVRSIKRCFSLKEYIVLLLTVAISAGSGVGVFYVLKKDVVIDDNGRRVIIRTMVDTVDEVLRQKGISLESYDYISVPVDSSLKSMEINEVIIKRAVPVFIYVDGTTREIMTCSDNVESVLAEASVELDEYDRLEGAALDSPVVEKMKIGIVRVDKEYVSEKMYIPYKVEEKPNHSMNRGSEEIVQEGSDGVNEIHYCITYEDGKEISKSLVLEKPLSPPVSEVIEYGTVSNITSSRGDVIRYKEVLDMRATAYTASFKDTGKHPDHPEFGITYTGIKAEVGVIAVDPKVIPLGTKVYVEMPGDAKDYGYALAADIGSAIKGDLIDLYMDTQEEVDRWGCRKCKVYILYDQ